MAQNTANSQNSGVKEEVLEEVLKIGNIENFIVYYSPGKRVALHNEIVIGLGSQSESQGIVLNNKEAKKSSVSELIYSESEETLQLWREALKSDLQPEKAHIYLEDLSPDTCLGFILFYLRVRGVDLQLIDRKWIHYVTLWEKGDVKTTGQPFESWGCLHNALSHTYFDRSEHENSTVFQEGFKSCIRFVVQLIKADMDPSKLDPLKGSEYYHRAVALLQHEYQEYKQMLNHALTVQLQLPLKDTNRKILVDAFLVKERKHLGTVKVFLRNDLENSWSKKGFAFMAVHNPDLVGTGSDITVSVDTSVGVHLKELWDKLEEMENDKWEGNRPTCKPRYTDLRSMATEPWYDENKKYTILGAPKKLPDGRMGSALKWDDVLQSIWELYHPAKDLRVSAAVSGGGESYVGTYLVHECKPLISDRKYQKQFMAVKWDHSQKDQSIIMSPTMKRYLAACAAGRFTLGKLPRMQELPQESNFDFETIPGGFVVLHKDGALLFDDWSRDQVDVDKYKSEFLKVLKRYGVVQEKYEEIHREVSDIKEITDQGKVLNRKKLIALNNRITKLKMELRYVVLETMTTNTDHHLEMFREKLERRWGISSKLVELYEIIGDIENIIKSYTEIRTNQLVSFITIYGFPFALFGGLFQFSLQDMHGPRFLGMHIIGVVLFLTLSVLAVLFLRQRLKKIDK
ncbi:hypothetical protein [Bacillus mycoides]|uniref:hypothetical protein n=1 Tax=Bacillus mycoides TaxID=1405 RepID=UPI00086409A7|nr:hypothetical protein [Bacillus mycoides]OHX28451.1 hypothetical protein BWGOE5_56480 [Bacillus mycoides]SCM90565.1 Putative uncharacterized protein [Bacillus mycoides]